MEDNNLKYMEDKEMTDSNLGMCQCEEFQKVL